MQSLVPFAGIGPATSPLPRECSTTEPKGHKNQSLRNASTVERGRRIELLALAWKAKVLPLYEPRTKSWHWWRGLDSNQRTRKRADLQSAAINHSATSPLVSHGLCHEIRGSLPARPWLLKNVRILRMEPGAASPTKGKDGWHTESGALFHQLVSACFVHEPPTA